MYGSRKKELIKRQVKALPPLGKRLWKFNKDFEEDIEACRKNPESEPSGCKLEEDVEKKTPSELDKETDKAEKTTDGMAAKQVQKSKRENIEAWFVKLKGTKINHAVVVEKTNELVSELEKKETDRLLLSEQLQLLRQRADQEQLGPALSIKLLIHSVVCIFDYNVKVQACMEAETWQLCLGKFEELLKVLIRNQDVQLNYDIPEKSENIAVNNHKLEPRLVQIVTLIECLET
ncbi:eukaryotic translation initiation factor 3 subunit C-like [Corticium candelabrum]|uniref:eukaryotic translation initiation factor 3 subunit C-like n=1 Tax=Corticium candelabrum TaxID=121492 RepID=UPI002E36BBE4|nr:eukaryotic translation initiation factor 3 subunit C-like [Corticium candelabrum]